MAEQILGRNADPVGERLVGEAQPKLPVEVENRQADAVGHEPQPVLALPGLELQPLQVIDVAVRRQKTADVALLVAIGVVVDAHPERLAARERKLPFVAGAFATERRVDVGAVQLIVLAAEHLDDLAAEHLVGPLAEPVEQCLVDEPVTLVAIDVRDRRTEGVQLALGERRQRSALNDLAHRLRYRCQVQTTDRTGKGHRALLSLFLRRRRGWRGSRRVRPGCPNLPPRRNASRPAEKSKERAQYRPCRVVTARTAVPR